MGAGRPSRSRCRPARWPADRPRRASTIVYVCDKDLCRTDEHGPRPVRLTRDGAAGAYSRPTLSLDGKRLAFKRGARGRAYTARLKRRALSDVTRIGPRPTARATPTQFDVAISPDGKRVAWVEQRVNVVSGTIDYRRYMAGADGSSPRQVAVLRRAAVRGVLRRVADPARGPDRGGRRDAGGRGGRLRHLRPVTGYGDQRHLPRRRRRAAGRLRRSPPAPPVDVAAPPPAGRHRLPSTESIDDAIERPGQIVLFDARTARPSRTDTGGRTAAGVLPGCQARRVHARLVDLDGAGRGRRAKRLVSRGTPAGVGPLERCSGRTGNCSSTQSGPSSGRRYERPPTRT